ncbi:CD63 antigen [Nymphon striatum]|nr:CD63 antigen [Nymphon striatum]
MNINFLSLFINIKNAFRSALAGLTCVGVGAWLVRDSDFADIAGNIKDGDIFTGAYVLIGVGGTVFIVAMIGCSGAFIESKCMILTYFVFVVIVIIAELSTVCYIWSQYPEPYVFLENILSQEVLDYRTNEDSRTFLDTIQEKMRCCGVNSYSDYLNANTTEPRSCSDVDTHATYKTGCAAKIWPFISQLFVILGGIASGVGIFQTHLLPTMKRDFPDGDGIFQQDLAPCHTSCKMRTFFEESGLEVLDWPGNSPDINPIENLWVIMKRRLQKEDCSTMTKLISAGIRAWYHDEELAKMCSNLVESMPNRVQMLVKAKGGHISY